MATEAAAGSVAYDDWHAVEACIFNASLHLTYVLSLIGYGFTWACAFFGVDGLLGCFCRVLHGFFATY